MTSEKKTPKQLSAERTKRFHEAIHLKQPDRIPIILPLGHLLADLEGITRQELYDDAERARQALVNAARRFQPDAAVGAWGNPGPSRVLGDRSTKWPGYGLPASAAFQFHEMEVMKAEEYDDFLRDPGDWSLRAFLPRVFSELEGLSQLPPLAMSSLGYYGLVPNLGVLTNPGFVKAAQALAKAAQLQLDAIGEMMATEERLIADGFAGYPFPGVLLEAPFDFVSDTMRGMKGVFTDMRRCPDKLLAAQEVLGQVQLRYAIDYCLPMMAAGTTVFAEIPLHRGSDEFISVLQFERFYWPELKKLLLGLIDAGITPSVFWEGEWDKRLQYLAELPKGKSVGYFQRVDFIKAKEILGDTMCIMGGMPISLLYSGTAQQVRDHTKRLCETVGKGGGFIMTSDIAEMEGCKPELITAWVEATKEYGQY